MLNEKKNRLGKQHVLCIYVKLHYNSLCVGVCPWREKCRETCSFNSLQFFEVGMNLISSLYFFFFTNTMYYFHKIVKYLDLRKKRYINVTSFLSGIYRKELWIRPLHQNIRRSPESRIVFRRMEKRSQNIGF